MIVVVGVDNDGDKVVFVIHYCVNEPINTTLSLQLFYVLLDLSSSCLFFEEFLSGVSPLDESGVNHISTYEKKKTPRVRFKRLC